MRRADDASGPTATLDDVDIRAELANRPPRQPDYAGEDRALAMLAQEMARNPRNMLQKLVEVAVDLCRADTAGISLLEGDVFRWEAVAGVFASYRNGTMPRGESPCGVCIDRNVTQLMYLADRAFPALRAEPRFVEALLIPFHFHGQPVGTVWIVTHTHDRKFDREDERVVRTLAQFASAGWQLWKAYEAADEGSRRKDEFVAMLGHELRNPLAAILSASSVLRMLGMTDASARHAVDVVHRQGLHLSRMVDDLLDVSRLSRGSLELHTEAVELRTVVEHAVETTRAKIERRSQTLAIDLPAAPVWLLADPVRMVQLLGNLLDNAAKYTPEGGRIWLTATHAEAHVEVTVGDTGVGLAKEHLRAVFDLFTQVGHVAQRSESGFGLGLALARTLVEMHGGTIEAASDGPGKGSQFTIRLPIAARVGEFPVKESAPTVTPTPRRILVVEDNADVAETFGVALALDGHTVRTAHSGWAALEAAEDFDADVVLLDVGLPDMSGYEVARRLRQGGRRAGLTIIALSGYGQDEDRARSKEAGCDLHLVKPVDLDHLQKILAGTIAR